MAKQYIAISDQNIKVIKNFLGMCRMNGLESAAAPSFNFKDPREGLGTVSFDLYYDFRGIEKPVWKLIVKVDTEKKLHDDNSGQDGDQFSYLDSYVIDQGSTDLVYKNSRFNIFSY